uniref:Lectin 1A n=1 Tax=Arenicola marina TaxID=6344 RepID=E3VL78_AREMA|nr:lectin 1A [Arenicola marina]
MWSHFVIAASLVAVVYGQRAPPVGPAQCPCDGLEARLAVLENTVLLLAEKNRDNISTVNMCENVEARRCEAMQTGSDYTTLDATGPGSWPGAGLCRVVSGENTLNLDQYVYTVELYNQASVHGIHAGHPGLAYNVIDVNNFDFVYFRPHYANDGRCLQHGYVISGAFHGTSEDRCTGAPVRGGTWFKVKVESSHGRASVYVNDVKLSEVNAHFPTRSQTGIIVPNGFRNVIRFRNSALTAL